VLAGDDGSRRVHDGFTRLDLADAICDPKNPLTARVIVNRVWQQHFGRGIVATASNFGELGERPTHPELLDTLAVRFIESGWSLKWLHRQIVHSAAYQLSSSVVRGQLSVATWDLATNNGQLTTDTPHSEFRTPNSKDPDNRLLWRFTPRRLDAEAWRDAILAVAGRLDQSIGGPAAGRAEAGHVRRTIYSTISRREPDKMLVTFDFPDANVTTEKRDVTTVPQQQLFALNSDFMQQSASALAARAMAASDDLEARIDLVYGSAFGRRGTTDEHRFAREFLGTTETLEQESELTKWEQFCHAVLASNEFSWID
jgi:hypothetical protein